MSPTQDRACPCMVNSFQKWWYLHKLCGACAHSLHIVQAVHEGLYFTCVDFVVLASSCVIQVFDDPAIKRAKLAIDKRNFFTTRPRLFIRR